MKNLISIFILIFMLCTMLAGCDDSGKTGGSDDTPAGDSQRPSTGDNDSGENEDIILGEDSAKDENTTPGGDSGANEDITPEGGENNGTTEGGENNGTPEGGEIEPENKPTVGYNVGNLAPSMAVEAANGGTVSIDDYKGKVVVINLWGEWCYYCKVELPDFSRVAAEYDDVIILAIHSNYGRAKAPDYISENYSESEIVFAYDNATDDYSYMLGCTGAYPRTLVLDKNGVITYARNGAISYDVLVSLVENAGAVK